MRLQIQFCEEIFPLVKPKFSDLECSQAASSISVPKIKTDREAPVKGSRVITVSTLIGVIFVPIGVAALMAFNKVVEIGDHCDAACIQGSTDEKVPKDLDQPIYVYDQLDNFYQNHRRYVKRQNDAQLTDSDKSNDTSGRS
ncbi:hypothetical protein ZIOFF_065354 [Zingiber officinale]|uniref:Uncharacterized protein n=1 Tax=Zingiber officinale TaxID=94328 RepID=A0A8J5KD42_ZINOF|nr:hypothetical protein ZIOFF_065354 [Zingiber officinale]